MARCARNERRRARSWKNRKEQAPSIHSRPLWLFVLRRVLCNVPFDKLADISGIGNAAQLGAILDGFHQRVRHAHVELRRLRLKLEGNRLELRKIEVGE